jgi:hypothetical protein
MTAFIAAAFIALSSFYQILDESLGLVEET